MQQPLFQQQLLQIPHKRRQLLQSRFQAGHVQFFLEGMGAFPFADAKSDGRDIPAERDIGIGTAGTECGLQPGPFPDRGDPVIDFVMLHAFTARALSQKQCLDLHIRSLVGFQDGLKSSIQLFQLRMGNRPHVHGEFHLSRNGIDGGPSLDGPHIVGGFRISGHLEIVKIPDDSRRLVDGVGRPESGTRA